MYSAEEAFSPASLQDDNSARIERKGCQAVDYCQWFKDVIPSLGEDIVMF
jgi:hypothetical protein